MTSRYPDGDPIVIAAAVRTPMGGFQGELATATAPELGATAIRAAVERAGLASDQVDEVIMGCVLPAGLGQAPARQASLGAGIPESVGCTTVNKMCGSGMKAAMMAHDLLNYHPLDNGRTTAIRSADLLQFLSSTGHEAVVADLAG